MRAYLLITTAAQADVETRIICAEINRIVMGAKLVTGPYDIIAEVVAPNKVALNEAIAKVRNILTTHHNKGSAIITCITRM